MSYDIVTKKVLNEETGEIESVDFKSIYNKKKIKGGYRIMYKSYEDIQCEVIKSGKDVKLFHWITNKFTYMNSEVCIVSSDYKEVSQPVFSRMIKRLTETQYIKRVGRGVYRLNPFVYLPYKANGSILQKEWDEL